MARSRVAWCPGGRTTASPRWRWPAMICVASSATPPAAPRAASQVSGEKYVSGSIHPLLPGTVRVSSSR